MASSETTKCMKELYVMLKIKEGINMTLSCLDEAAKAIKEPNVNRGNTTPDNRDKRSVQ